MAYDLPTAWKMDGLELSIEQKLNYLAAHVAALEAGGGGGSTVSVTAEYTEQTYNNKLATITVDETPTTINAPKVDVTNLLDDGGSAIGTIKIGSTSKTIRMPLSVMQGTQIEMPPRVLLGFQTAMAQINASSVKRVYAYTSSTSEQDDIDLADEMIGELENGKLIFPSFALLGGNSVAYPVSTDITYNLDNVPETYNLYYKLPVLMDPGSGLLLYDIYVDMAVHSNVSGYTSSGFVISIIGIMHSLSS